jgi:precorrin-2 methylase
MCEVAAQDEHVAEDSAQGNSSSAIALTYLGSPECLYSSIVHLRKRVDREAVEDQTVNKSFMLVLQLASAAITEMMQQQ